MLSKVHINNKIPSKETVTDFNLFYKICFYEGINLLYTLLGYMAI